jgi:hypothetical protein
MLYVSQLSLRHRCFADLPRGLEGPFVPVWLFCRVYRKGGVAWWVYTEYDVVLCMEYIVWYPFIGGFSF